MYGLQPENWMVKFDSKNEICVIEKSSVMERLIDKNTAPETKKSPGKFGDRQDFSKKR